MEKEEELNSQGERTAALRIGEGEAISKEVAVYSVGIKSLAFPFLSCSFRVSQELKHVFPDVHSASSVFLWKF